MQRRDRSSTGMEQLERGVGSYILLVVKAPGNRNGCIEYVAQSAPSFVAPSKNFLRGNARSGLSRLHNLFNCLLCLRASLILRRGSISRRLTIAAYDKRLAAFDLFEELGETSAGI